jgi:hypothetical protein
MIDPAHVEALTLVREWWNEPYFVVNETRLKKDTFLEMEALGMVWMVRGDSACVPNLEHPDTREVLPPRLQSRLIAKEAVKEDGRLGWRGAHHSFRDMDFAKRLVQDGYYYVDTGETKSAFPCSLNPLVAGWLREFDDEYQLRLHRKAEEEERRQGPAKPRTWSCAQAAEERAQFMAALERDPHHQQIVHKLGMDEANRHSEWRYQQELSKLRGTYSVFDEAGSRQAREEWLSSQFNEGVRRK